MSNVLVLYHSFYGHVDDMAHAVADDAREVDGAQESTILSYIPTLLRHGKVVLGMPYSEQCQMGLDEIKGGSPYGAGTIAGTKGERMLSEQELGMAQFQGRQVAEFAKRLSASV